MKKTIGIFLLIIAVFFTATCAIGCGEKEKPLRLHIRANSNAAADQAVKLAVRDEVISFLTPLLQDVKNVKEAKKTIKDSSKEIEEICEKTLGNEGYFYGAELKISEEYFPSRSYGNLTLEAGNYEAVIINLGCGSGDNWWCVAYPPLCFGGEETEYRSIILDFINGRKNGKDNQ